MPYRVYAVFDVLFVIYVGFRSVLKTLTDGYEIWNFADSGLSFDMWFIFTLLNYFKDVFHSI